MRCYFASASDDAADYFFAIDDDGPLPQYIISHKIFSLLLLKILTPSHLMDLKSIRPSPYWKFCHSKSVQPSPVINFDIQRKTTKRFKEQEERAKLSWGLKTFEIRNSKHEFVDVIFHIFQILSQEISIGHNTIFVVRRAWWSRKLGQELNDIAIFSKIKQDNSKENHERTLIGKSWSLDTNLCWRSWFDSTCNFLSIVELHSQGRSREPSQPWRNLR